MELFAMNDKQVVEQFDNITESTKLDEILRIIEHFLAILESKLPKEIYRDIERKFDFAKMLWRHCPEKLLYPALDKWVKALQNDIDPREIFMLGWHTGVMYQDLLSSAKASLKGRLHRKGIRTDDKSKIDPRLCKVYKEYNSPENRKTLNQLLQREFAISKINKPNAELNRLRARYYRASRTLKLKQYQENIPGNREELLSTYLQYYLRHHFVYDYTPSGELCIACEKRGGRTHFDSFINEKAYAKMANTQLEEYIQRKQKQKQNRKKRKDPK